MTDFDPSRLTEAITKILREGNQERPIQPDQYGWVPVDAVCAAVSVVLDKTVVSAQVQSLDGRARLEVRGTRVRIQRRPRHIGGPTIPDILFHATTREQTEQVKASDLLGGGRRRITVSADEVQAWRAAHRMQGSPEVLVIDTLRARRAGVRFYRNRHNGLFSASDVPAHHILNLRRGYDVQLSAGGIPVVRDADGEIRMALIRVTRRSGVTWEVAKGKMEPGETPELTAVREVQEEMGVEVAMNVIRYVGPVRYGFLAPGGEPRLKTIYLYLMEPEVRMEEFKPSTREGIGDVQWFTVDEACEAVTHSSLRPLMRRARELLSRHGLDVAPELRPVERAAPSVRPDETTAAPADEDPG